MGYKDFYEEICKGDEYANRGAESPLNHFIPILSKPAVQFAGMLPKRIKALNDLKAGRVKGLKYVKLNANYEAYLGPDSDACNGLDPCQIAVWYEERGHKCISHLSYKQKLFIRTENIVIKKTYMSDKEM